MTRRRKTKRALLASLLSMMLCVSMLIGSTFAWFTDNASTNVNRIQSGTLKLKLEMADGNGGWTDAEGEVLEFLKASGGEDESPILWEPGATYRLPQLKITNVGNLALKYKVEITGIQGDAKLNNVIEWTIDMDYTEGTNEGHLDPDGESYIDISGHMKEDAGNDYQDLSIDGIAITVKATQDTVEHDSNNDQYDAAAQYGTGSSNIVDVNNGLAQGDDVVISDINTAETITTTKPEQKITVESGKIDTDKFAAIDTTNGGDVIVNDGEISASQVALRQNSGTTVLNGGTFNAPAIVWGNGQNVTINGGEYDCQFIILNDSSAENIVSITGGDFTVSGKIEEGGNNAVTITGGTFNVDPTAYVPEGYAVIQNADGTFTVEESNIKEDGDGNVSSTPDSVEDLKEIFELAASSQSGNTITIEINKDWNLEGDWEAFTPKGYTGVNTIIIEGNGHTISGLNQPLMVGSFAGSGSVTINDLTIDSANIAGEGFNGLGLGAFVAYSDTSGELVLNDCHLTDSNINCTGEFAGGLVGYSSSAIKFSGCSVTDSIITSGKSAGAIIGQDAAAGQMDDITVTNCKITSTGMDEGKKYCGTVVGTSNAAASVYTNVTTSGNTINGELAETYYGRAFVGLSINETEYVQ